MINKGSSKSSKKLGRNVKVTQKQKGDSQEQQKPSPDIRRIPPAGKNSWAGASVIVVLVLGVFLAYSWFTDIAARGDLVNLSEIFVTLRDEELESEKITLRDGLIILEWEDTRDIAGQELPVKEHKHAYVDATYSNRDLNEDLRDYEVDPAGIEIYYERGSDADLIINILWLVVFGVGIFLVYNMLKGMQASGGKLMDFGQSKARLIFGRKTGITFDDVAGIDDVKEELVEVIDFLRRPKKYTALGARIPKGVLLVGAPGTGKTLLAKAVAGEAGVPFFHTSGSEFEEMLVGAGASRVRDLFTKAKRASPCIIFIDEIDAVAKKRGTVLHSGAGEQTLNQILVEMDGLEERANVIILAATNRPDVLDPAILRPGRFDRSVTVQMPDFDGRREIIDVHAKGKKFDETVDLDVVAKKTIGYSGADLENLLNEAAIMAARDDRKAISQQDLMESYLKVKFGRQRKKSSIDEDLERVAYHEAGHAVVANFIPEASPVEKVSIISRGTTGGVTVYIPEDDRSLMTQPKIEAMLAASVGGKVAEEIFFGNMSTGASGDIKSVSDIARAMVQRYGMSEKLGFVAYGSLEDVSHLGYQYGGQRDYSEKTAQLIDDEVKRISDEAQVKAKKILEDNKEGVKKLVELLLEKEEVDKEEFDALFSKDDMGKKED